MYFATIDVVALIEKERERKKDDLRERENDRKVPMGVSLVGKAQTLHPKGLNSSFITSSLP